MIADAAAFLDRTGKVIAAGEGFRQGLGLSAQDISGALQLRAERDPAFKEFLSGAGPDRVRVFENGSAVELSRSRAESGTLVFLTSVEPEAKQDQLEHASRSFAMTRLVAGVSHDIRNPLNAMALQIALLTEKLSMAGEEVAAASAGHLGSLKGQIARVNEVLRRFLDVAEPSAPFGYTDLGSLVTDLICLFGHESRRRGIEMVAEAASGAVRSSCDPARAGRLVLGLFARALAETPDGGRISVRAFTDGGEAGVQIEHVRGPAADELAYVPAMAAASAQAMEGRFLVSNSSERELLELRFPRYLHA